MRAHVQPALINAAALASAIMIVPGVALALSNPPQTSAKILAPDGAANDLFGIAASISESTLAIGSDHHDAGGTTKGSVYLFDRASTGAWALTQKLVPASGGVDDAFGRHAILQGDRLYVTASADDERALDAGARPIREWRRGRNRGLDRSASENLQFRHGGIQPRAKFPRASRRRSA